MRYVVITDTRLLRTVGCQAVNIMPTYCLKSAFEASSVGGIDNYANKGVGFDLMVLI